MSVACTRCLHGQDRVSVTHRMQFKEIMSRLYTASPHAQLGDTLFATGTVDLRSMEGAKRMHNLHGDRMTESQYPGKPV